MLTRKEMEGVIQAGGSVLHKGRIITSIGELPTDADLAATDEQRLDVAKGLEEQAAVLLKQAGELKKPTPKAEAPEPEEVKEPEHRHARKQ